MLRYMFSLVWALSLLSCLQGQSEADLSFDAPKLQLLDSTAAAQIILQDETEDYFKKVGKLDMAIQMKQRLDSSFPRQLILERYQEYVQTDVASFSDSEKERLVRVFERAFFLCERFQPDLLPSVIQVMKVKGKTFGPDAYFTRENVIAIPAPALRFSSEESLLQVMLHEFFHLYSRAYPGRRDKLYELIGFSRVDQLRFPSPLRERLLLNPDGIDVNWAINLTISPDSVVRAIPLLYSNQSNFRPEQPGFFSYLEFELFAIEKHPESGFSVLCTENGKSTLGREVYDSFYRQIRDNTDYVIHPDEILADNFVLLILETTYPSLVDELSPGGHLLLKAMKAIIRAEAE